MQRDGKAVVIHGGFAVPRATLFDRAKLMRMLAVNSDILVRTAALITVFLFFTAKGARAGDVTLAANSVLNNFLLVSAFFLDGLANAAQQLCGRTFGARDAKGFADSTRLVLSWGLGFAMRDGAEDDGAGRGAEAVDDDRLPRLPEVLVSVDVGSNPAAPVIRDADHRMITSNTASASST